MKMLVVVPFTEKQKHLLKEAAGDAEIIFLPGAEVTEEETSNNE